MPRLELSLSRLELPLVHTFTIARGSESLARTLVFRLRWGYLIGLGEASPTPRYDESIESVERFFGRYRFAVDEPYRLDHILDALPPAARCGLDIALHDLIGRDLGRPLWQLLGLDPHATPITSFTIGIDSIDRMVAKVLDVRTHPILKIKLGAGREIETMEAIRAVYTGTIRIDANEAWSPERAVDVLRELERFDIELCEQPIPAGSPERLRWIREHVHIPIVADEDARDARDLAALHGCVDGVNIKLIKCGGIRAALAMIHTARALGLRIMLGCMVESSILATAAAHLSPLVDWADIDGPFLTAHDPFVGVRYGENGRLILPDGPGLGVAESHEEAVSAQL
ncbi:MAG TPA: dipeptide epimerase [Candidatus Acidoferrales bacterium]|nr:dipeptide epimerase [Candidatus Acidoferrales bacterium]